MELFLSSFVSLFVIVDPVGTAAVFLALTQGLQSKEARVIALKSVIIAAGLLVFFAYAGKAVLLHVGISFDAFRIAGGILLFVTAFRMIMGFHDSPSVSTEDGVYKDHSNIAVFPLAIPLLAGPGCMAAVVLNVDLATNALEKGVVVGSILLVQFLAFIGMVFSYYIVKTIGNTGSSILARLMGILLAGLSVQFIADGILNMVEARW